MGKFHTCMCNKCSRIYSRESSNGDTCYPCSQAIKDQEGVKPNRTCVNCQSKFYSPNGLQRCPHCSMKAYNNRSRGQKIYDISKITSDKSSHRLPLHVLNKIEEKKRIYDEGYAEKYVRYGRIKDRI